MRRYNLTWGNDTIPPQYATEHFLTIGTTGSGKSVTIGMLMKSALADNQPIRALIYDAKQEILPSIFGIVGRPERVRVLHPFDKRGCAWDLAADIDGPVTAREFATILVPDTETVSSGSESFFNQAVRDLITGVILAFIQCVPRAGKWTFRDVILTLLYPPYLEFILSLDTTRDNKPFPYASRLRSSYLEGDERVRDNIRATINAILSIFEPVAAVWHRAQKADQVFSLNQWLKKDCHDIVILGNDEAGRTAIDSINRAIFRRASQLLLAADELTDEEKESGSNLTWFFMDEVREAGKLDGLRSLLTKGRSKGACVVLGFQDIDGLRAVYGTEVANELCGQCSNIAVLKLSSPTTAEWAVKLFGSRLIQAEGTTRGLGSDGTIQEGRNINQEERPYLYTADLLYLPRTSPKNGLTGFFRGSYRNPEEEGFREHLPWNEAIQGALPVTSDNPEHVKYQPQQVSEHYLNPWDQEDWERLGLTRFTSSPIAYNAKPHQQPKVNTEVKKLGNLRSTNAP